MKYILFFLLSGTAYADDKQEEPKVVYKQRTEIDFEGVEIDGELVRPQGSLLLERKHAKFNPMIKLRADFDDMMEDSVKEVK
mgnify:FL=1|jgi:hypothetical protein